MLLLISHKTVCGEEPVIFFLLQGEGIHGIFFHAVISGMD